MRVLRHIIWISIVFIGCNNPSASIGSIVSNSAIHEIDTYCYDVDLTDNIIVVAASNGGYYKYSYELNSDAFPVLTPIVQSQSNHNPDFYNDSIDRVVISDNDVGMIYMLDKYSGGSSGIWFDSASGVSVDPSLVSDYCFQGKYLDITLDESELPNSGFETKIIYSLMKHTDLNENNDDDLIASYSSSIVKRTINIIQNESAGELQSVDLIVGDCEFLQTLNYDSNAIDFNNNKLAVASESEGIIVFEKNDSGSIDNLFNSSDLFSFNLSGGEAQTVSVLEDAVIGGFSNDKGCYMALLGSDASETVYLSFGEGYSIKGIDYSNGLIALATGSDGVQLYQWGGGNNVLPYGSIETDYAYSVVIRNGLVFVATKSGLEIYKIGN